jgi:predicted protein tyrosine phosphatase
VTTQDERTRNLLQAGAFLKELQADASLPESVRNEARRLLRHYPTVADIQLLAKVEKRMSGSAKAAKQMAKATGAELLARAPRAPALNSPLRMNLSEPEHALRLPKEMKAANPDPLAALRDDFDRLVERMQTPAHQAAVDALFTATGAEIGAVAAAHAREGARLQAQTKQKTTAKKRLLGRMVKSSARAGAAIDDAVAHVEASNRERARRMHILFVCSLCRLRSPTAEQVFATRADWDVMAAGINAGADNPVTPELLEWADTIFVMEEPHRTKLSKKFSAYLKDKRIVCLNIPDKYDYMDPRLVRQLKAKVPKLLR